MKLTCYACGNQWSHEGKVFKTDTCPACDADARCCKMCVFYDKTAYNECRESQAERITDKEKANYCDYFRPGGEGGTKDEKQATLNALDDLFK